MSRPAPHPVRHVDDDERRARLGIRHGLAPQRRFSDVVAATRGMTVLHATEPASVHLALRARVEDVTIADVEAALYQDRTIVKQGAMRQTLFGFTRDLLPAAWGSASARVARSLRARLAKDVQASGLAADGDAWLAEVAELVVDALGEREVSAAELRQVVPVLDAKVQRGAGRWGVATPVAPQVLWLLHAQARVQRGHNGGHWRLSKPRWTSTSAWLGQVPEPMAEREGYAELVRRWLHTFGPGAEADLAWWLGGTLGAVRTALADVEAVPVSLDRTEALGWLLPADHDPVEPPAPWVALLPTLDPTVMGWRERDFYIGPHRAMTFDSAGNAGSTAWSDGRVVGCWVQDADGAVRVHLLEEVPARARRALAAEADRVTAWLDGVVVNGVYASAAMKEARAAGG
ncbi:winged helix DNA-binding domain-containing protein [Pseudactinotalea suaedae]|uniref:winged helix DNA-binding domain-containing protein n=1 Tax=Pseudactinotalea suaedae TaxID=1524924 RepID=UPI0012E3013D|nr:winged helix DNA-binding domain-containing protein [Pseudactinotalea suaedae]